MTGTLGAQAVVESAVLQPATIKLAASFQLTVHVLNAKEAGTCACWIVISFTLTVLFSHSVPANSPESLATKVSWVVLCWKLRAAFVLSDSVPLPAHPENRLLE